MAWNGDNALVFRVAERYFALNAAEVVRSVWLPWLTPIEEVPACHSGIFDLQGQVVQVIDLNLRFSRSQQPCGVDDVVIIVRSGKQLLGVIAQELLDVTELVILEQQEQTGEKLLIGEAHFEEQLVMLLDSEQLLQVDDSLTSPSLPAPCYSGMDERSKALLKQRAEEYCLLEEGRSGRKIEIVVVVIGEERFGLQLNEIHEFADITPFAHIPCCPAFVTGNMNLRGEIVTLFNLGEIFDLPLNHSMEDGKCVIYQHEELLLGVVIESVDDTLMLDYSLIFPLPAAVAGRFSSIAQGEFRYHDQMITLLNMGKLFDSGVLFVDEEVA